MAGSFFSVNHAAYKAALSIQKCIVDHPNALAIQQSGSGNQLERTVEK
jgi:hypothetical protein